MSLKNNVVRKVRIVGVPLDLGADHRGIDMGPDALRSECFSLDLIPSRVITAY
jgi:arginase family enzyme